MDFNEIIKELLLFLGLVGGYALIYGLLTYVKLKVNNSKLNEAIDIILDAVDHVSQIFVDNLKKEGRFDKSAQEEALKMAVDEIMKMMSPTIKKYIESNYGDVEAWVIAKIESYIKRKDPYEYLESKTQMLND